MLWWSPSYDQEHRSVENSLAERNTVAFVGRKVVIRSIGSESVPVKSLIHGLAAGPRMVVYGRVWLVLVYGGVWSCMASVWL